MFGTPDSDDLYLKRYITKYSRSKKYTDTVEYEYLVIYIFIYPQATYINTPRRYRSGMCQYRGGPRWTYISRIIDFLSQVGSELLRGLPVLRSVAL